MYPVLNKPFIQIFTFSLLLAGAWLGSGCHNQTSHWQQEGDVLVAQNTALNAKLLSLNAKVDSLWDTVSVQLDHAIPPDFPAVDRNIFIKARNAGHIRMFMSYKQLDPAIHSLVDQAGVADSLFALQIQQVYAERQAFEQQKIHFLSEVEKSDKALSKTLADKFRTAKYPSAQ